MEFMKGAPLVSKLAAVAKYGLLPAAMIAAFIYSPPDYTRPNDKKNQLPSR